MIPTSNVVRLGLVVLLGIVVNGAMLARSASAQGIPLPGPLNDLARDILKFEQPERPFVEDRRRPYQGWPAGRELGQKPANSNTVAQQPPPHTQATAVFQSDGVTLSGALSQMAVAASLKCSDSQKHPGMKLCINQNNNSVLSVVTNKDGNVAYFSRYLGPARITTSGIHNNIAHLSELFGTPRVADETTASDGSYSIIASWGQLSLTQVPSDAASNDHSMYIQYPRRAEGSTEDTRLYRVSNGPGFFFLASNNGKGSGILRYGAYSDATFNSSPTAAADPARPATGASGSSDRGIDLPPDEQGSVNYYEWGVTLSAPVATNNFQCAGSDRVASMTVCINRPHGMSVLVNPAGRAAYFEVEPDYVRRSRLDRARIGVQIHNLTARYGDPHIVSEKTGDDGSYSVLVTWGSLRLVEAPAGQADRSMYLTYLDRTSAGESASKLFRFDRGAGFFLTASFDGYGQGDLKFGAYNDRTFKDVRSAADAAADPILGEWVGTATCEGKQRDLSLYAETTPSSDFGATIAFFDDTALSVPVPHIVMLARQEATGGTYRFVPRERSDTLSFTATLAKDVSKLDVASNTCGSFTLGRPVMSPAPPIVRNTPPHDAYHETDALEARCKAIGAWASRITKEYPGTDLNHTAMGQLYPKAVLLFSDYDFLPTFGFSYDPFSVPEGFSLGAIGRDLTRACGEDPFARQESAGLWGNSLFQSAFPSKVMPFSINDNGSFQVSAIRHFVRNARAVQAVIAGKLADRSPDATGSIAGLINIRSYVDDHKLYLWPSDLAELDSSITASIQSRALTEATRQISQLRSERDPTKGIAAARSLLSGNSTSAIENMGSADKEKAVSQVDELAHKFAEKLFAPFQSEIDRVSTDLAGVHELNDMTAKSKDTVSLFLDQDRQAFAAKFSDRSNQILTNLVSNDLDGLRNYPASREGLKADCDWVKNFNGKYGEFSATDPVRNGFRTFESNRAARLIAALPEARDLLVKTEGDQARQLALRDYLCWPDDHRLPESLEYDFLAGQYGVGSLW